jgi:putative FmdB family regulatory protein
MPTYEYKCLSCEHNFEKFQPITSGTEFECPECGKPAKRQISMGGGIIFKGSGFYTTDYKNKSASKPSESAKKPECAACPSSAKCAETK